MENITNQKSYKVWHILVAFLLGVAITAGVVFVPSYMGAGFLRLTKDPNPIFPKGTCPQCACTSEIQNVKDIISSLLDPYTGKLGKRFDAENLNAQNNVTVLNALLDPYTGKLGERFTLERGDLTNLELVMVNLLHPYTGKLGERLTEVQNFCAR